MNFLVKTMYKIALKALQSLQCCKPLHSDKVSHTRRLHTSVTPLWETHILYRAPLFGFRAGRLLTVITICVLYADTTHEHLHIQCQQLVLCWCGGTVVKVVDLTLHRVVFSPKRVIQCPLNIHILLHTLSRNRVEQNKILKGRHCSDLCTLMFFCAAPFAHTFSSPAFWTKNWVGKDII
jgi:hypothetical protein